MKQALPKKVLLILILSLVLVGVGLGFTFLLFTSQTPSEKAPTSLAQKLHFLLAPLRHFKTATVQEQALAALEKNLQFCEVVSQEDLPDKKEFQLICNGRPFVAVWENEKISYELNGWSFLKEQPEVLKELQDSHCRFYQTSQDNLLVFVCQDEKVRKYTYSTPDFQLVKQVEELFLNEIFIDSWRTSVFPCDLTGAMRVDWEDESLIKLEIKCHDYDAELYFNFDKLYFTLPVVVDESLTDDEKVQKSIDLLDPYFCDLKEIKKSEKDRQFVANFDCPKKGKLIIEYDLNLGIANFLIRQNEFSNLFFFTGKKTFPWLIDTEVRYLVSSHDETNDYHYYSAGHQVIVAQAFKEGNLISEVYLEAKDLE